MFKDNQFDPWGTESATIVITNNNTFDKRALCTSDLTSLTITLSNMHYLASSFPTRFSIMLQDNGCLELLVRKARYLSNLSPDPKADIAFTSALACLASAAASGTAKLRYRIIQAKFVPVVLPILSAACNILDSIHQKMLNQSVNMYENNQNQYNSSRIAERSLDYNFDNVTLPPILDANISNPPSSLFTNQQELSQDSSSAIASSSSTSTTLDTSQSTALSSTASTIPDTASTVTSTTAIPLSTTLGSEYGRFIPPPPQVQLDTSPPNTRQDQAHHHHHRQSSSDTSFYEDSLLGSEDLNLRNVKVHDLLMICKITAYVSKYEATRSILRQRYPLFYLIENLTVPTVIGDIRRWAGSCMRNAVRCSSSTIEKRCGLITCANVHLGYETMESCDSCHSVYYCSPACKAFAFELHRHWCSAIGTCQSTQSSHRSGF